MPSCTSDQSRHPDCMPSSRSVRRPVQRTSNGQGPSSTRPDRSQHGRTRRPLPGDVFRHQARCKWRVGRGQTCEASGVIDMRTVVLVEGLSDQVALESLATRHGRNFAAEGVAIVPMGGATNIRRYLNRFGPRESNSKLAVLCDANEARGIRRSLEWAGDACSDRGSVDLYVCVADLEDELIRAIGAESV